MVNVAPSLNADKRGRSEHKIPSINKLTPFSTVNGTRPDSLKRFASSFDTMPVPTQAVHSIVWAKILLCCCPILATAQAKISFPKA